MTRRDALWLSVTALTGALARSGPVSAKCLFPQVVAAPSLRQAWPQGAYSTYPHSNGFLDPQHFVLARPSTGGGLDYFSCSLASGKATQIAHVPRARTYFAIGGKHTMAVPLYGALAIVDLGTGEVRTIETGVGWINLEDCDIDPLGESALVNQYTPNERRSFRICRIDLASGKREVIVAADYPLDHAHFSPFDQSWICFADARVHGLRRTWVWHANLAPQGRQIFQQLTHSRGRFDVGHERAMFNKLALLTIAYPDSSASPRGLYEVSFEGKTRLVSESNSDCHCNPSRDGRWAVVSSLSGVTDSNKTIDLCRRTPNDWANGIGYVASDVTAVNLSSGYRQLLFQASDQVQEGRSMQPFEAQPAISPDGEWVVIKDGRTQSVVSINIAPSMLKALLNS